MTSTTLDPVSLFRQNAAPDEVLAAFKNSNWSDSQIGALLRSEDVSADYVSKVAKAIISNHANASEDFQEAAMEVISRAFLKEKELMIWVEYGGTRVRVLNPYVSLEVQGDAQIGLRIWEAEICVLEWLEAHSDSVKGLSVLELGAGVGLAGVAAAERFGAQFVTLTDASPRALENLHVIAQKSPRHDVIKVECLQWFDSEQVSAMRPHDFIIAADCVYDPKDIPALTNTLEAFFEKNSKTTCLFACSIRNRETFKLLLEKLTASTRVSFAETSIPECNYRYSTNATHVFTKRWLRSNVILFILTHKHY